MKTVIFLSNHEVVAAEGTCRGERVMIHRICRARAPENSIINGVVTDPISFEQFLGKFWNENRLSRKKVILITGNAKTVSKHLCLPAISDVKKRNYLTREFAGVRRMEKPVFSYLNVGKLGNVDELFVNLADRDFLEDHIRRFQNRKIRLESIVTADMALVAALERSECIQKRTCIVQMLDGMYVQNILYVDGHYFHGNHLRLLNEPGTPESAAECAGCIDKMQQFLTVQAQEAYASYVYLTGEFSEDDRDAIQMHLQDHGSIEVHHLEPFLLLTGGFLLSKKSNNLFYQYRLAVERETGTRKRKYGMAAGVALIISLSLATGLLEWDRHRIMTRIEAQQKRLCDEIKSKDEREYDRLFAEIDEMQEQAEAIEKADGYLSRRSIYDANVRQTIQDCADDLVAVDIYSFDGRAGSLIIEIQSDSPERIHLLVDRLERRDTIFESVEYGGFSYDEKQGGWRSRIRLTLASCMEK